MESSKISNNEISPNLGDLFRVRFAVRGEGGKLPYPLSPLADVSIFFAKKKEFFDKIGSFTQKNNMRVVVQIFDFCF